MAAAAPAKATEPVPMPRSKPSVAAIFQLASADAQIVPAPKAKQAGPADKPAASADKSEPKPQTPADIINARGFWGDAPATPKQATPAQVAAINARKALAAADPQSTASISAAFHQALAYAPAAASPVERDQRRRRQRADPAQRPAGSQSRLSPPRSTRSSPRARRVRAA